MCYTYIYIYTYVKYVSSLSEKDLGLRMVFVLASSKSFRPPPRDETISSLFFGGWVFPYPYSRIHTAYITLRIPPFLVPERLVHSGNREDS